MAERIVLHIGTHKTGSTSLQQFLRDEDTGLLASAGISYPPGMVLTTSHSELPLVTIRPNRLWPARIRLPETRRPAWLAAAAAHIERQVRSPEREVVLFSHEDLSYLRFDDELERLRELLGGLPVRVVVFLRDAASFLRSYREQLEATGFPLSDDPASFAYVEPDSWLVDHDALLAGYRRWFGAESVDALDYDDAVQRDGTVIPAFASLLGIPRSSLPPLDRYFLNRTGAQLRADPAQLAALRRRLAEQAR